MTMILTSVVGNAIQSLQAWQAGRVVDLVFIKVGMVNGGRYLAKWSTHSHIFARRHFFAIYSVSCKFEIPGIVLISKLNYDKTDNDEELAVVDVHGIVEREDYAMINTMSD